MDRNTLINKVIVPLIIVVVGMLIYFILKGVVSKAFKLGKKRYKSNKYNTIEALIKTIIKYFIVLICLLIILDKYGIDTKSIITSLGIAGVALSLAMQDFLKDFVAGISIVLEDQYAIGDVVKIGNFMGTVSSFTLKTTRIKAWTGEEKIINNHLVTEVINYTHNNNLAIVDVSLPYEEDVLKLEEALTEICSTLTSELKNLKSDVKLLGLENLDSSAMVYRLVAEVAGGWAQFGTRREMQKILKRELDRKGINVPYSQLVIHNG